MPEQTAGQRIAARAIAASIGGGMVALQPGEKPDTWLAAAIDEAIREAREEGYREGRLSGKRAMQELMRSHSELQKQLAAKEADCAAMRLALTQLLPYFKSVSQFERESKALHDAWNAAIIRTANTDESDTAPDAVMAGFVEQALASNAGADLLARLRAAEKARDEHLHYIQYDLNPQLEAACDAITSVLGSEQWDGVPATIRLIGARLRAAEEEHARLQRTVAFMEKQYLEEHEHWGKCKWKARAEAAEEKAAALDQLPSIVAEAYEKFGYGHPIGAWLDARIANLAAIQAARAKEPSA